MPYDENSFLQGIAVGRSMKGVGVIAGGKGGGGKAAVVSRDLRPVGSIFALSRSVPAPDGGSAAGASIYIEVNGQAINTAAPAPSAFGLGGITAAAVITPDQQE